MKTANELREVFLSYFMDKAHKLVRSAPLIPAKDPTLLFTNAGMVQFKDVFLGRDKRPYRRATSVQKCLRVSGKHNDLEHVGRTLRHNTFFEMLGNFSFGDYFKELAIEFGWEFMTQVAKVPSDRLWISVYEEDDESRRLWEAVGVRAEHIVGLGEKDNFWAMGDVGPCGPCTEIYYDMGSEIGCGRPECAPGCDCDRFFEVWNLVFMQFDRANDGTLTSLPAPSVDTGMGLERLACVCQGKQSIFDTDLFVPIRNALGELCDVPVTSSGQEGIAFRAISDHIRSHCFLLADGLMPSNEGRGYVLRRLVRRAARFGQVLGLHEPFLFKLSAAVVAQMGHTYPELRAQKETIARVLRSEEERFQGTLNRAMPRVMEYVEEVKQAGGDVLDGERVFSFYDTFGFPLELVRDIAKENGLAVDERGFERAMLGQKKRARVATSGRFQLQAEDETHRDLSASDFEGYNKFELDECRVERIVKVTDGSRCVVESASDGSEVEVVLDRTPFYAESGGQVSDVGKMHSETADLDVTSVQKTDRGAIIHTAIVKTGKLAVGDRVRCRIDRKRRDAIARSHTATHLLNYALRSILGHHVKQSGSLVEPDRLRFDFTHFGPVSERELEMIESEVNEKIRDDVQVIAEEMSFDDATASGALAFFGEKYGDVVRVVSAGGFSKELCGGTHVSRTGRIGLFRVLSTSSVSAGVRRIEALTGERALEYDNRRLRELKELSEKLKTPLDSVGERVKSLIDEVKSLRKELVGARELFIKSKVSGLVKGAVEVKGVKVVAANMGEVDVDFLRRVCDGLKEAGFRGVAVLGAVAKNKVILICLVTQDLTNDLDAGHIIRKIAAGVGGSGGGRRDLAQAGGSRPERLEESLLQVSEVVSEALADAEESS